MKRIRSERERQRVTKTKRKNECSQGPAGLENNWKKLFNERRKVGGNQEAKTDGSQ
jgi:hypothetical protein